MEGVENAEKVDYTNTQLVVVIKNTDGNWQEEESYTGVEFMYLREYNAGMYECKIKKKEKNWLSCFFLSLFFMIIVLIHLGYVSFILFGKSKTISICDEEFDQHPALITKEEDKDIWMEGHYLDHGALKAFIGLDHKVHNYDDADFSLQSDETEFSVRASYIYIQYNTTFKDLQ